MPLHEIGRIKQYSPKDKVAVVELTEPLRVGNTIKIVSESGSFTQEVGAMQVERSQIAEATAGQTVGIKVLEKAGPGSKVFRLEVEREASLPPMLVGKITHYFPKSSVAVVKLNGPLRIGEMIKVIGHDTTFTQEVDSMQVDHSPIDVAQPGQSVGLKVKEKVREGNSVYKIDIETEPNQG